MADFNSSQASFIPKTNTAKSHKIRKTKRIYLLSYISYVLFFGTVIVVLGAYFYGIQADSALELKREELLEKQGRFNDSHVQYVTDLEGRLVVAQSLLAKSAAPSQLFFAIEETAADSVLYTSFEYKEGEDNSMIATFAGNAVNFDVAIFQREILKESSILSSASVSSFSYGEVFEDSQDSIDSVADRVNFTYELVIGNDLIAYDPSVYTDDLSESAFDVVDDNFFEETLDDFDTAENENDVTQIENEEDLSTEFNNE